VKLGGARGNLEDLKKGPAVSAAVRQKASADRAAKVMPLIWDAQAAGATSLRAIAKVLDGRNITAPRGGSWSAAQVKAVIDNSKVCKG
jgi:hypothetical protein